MSEPIKQEISAGGVVYDTKNGKFLIGKHSGYHKWVLPKGLVEKGESIPQAAVREVEEEVGVVAQIVDQSPLKIVEYYYLADLRDEKGVDAKGAESIRRVAKYAEQGGGKVRVHKKVYFFLMNMSEDYGAHGWEMEERKWLVYEEARELLAFESEREVLAIAKELIDNI